MFRSFSALDTQLSIITMIRTKTSRADQNWTTPPMRFSAALLGDPVIKRFSVDTTSRNQMIDITTRVEDVVAESEVLFGLCLVQSLHTTAGLTINENADPHVCADILSSLTEIVPFEKNYRHGEGNSDAHIKASLVGFSEGLFVDNGALVLGTWQGLYLCEFDGPRRRHIIVKVVADK